MMRKTTTTTITTNTTPLFLLWSSASSPPPSSSLCLYFCYGNRIIRRPFLTTTTTILFVPSQYQHQHQHHPQRQQQQNLLRYYNYNSNSNYKNEKGVVVSQQQQQHLRTSSIRSQSCAQQQQRGFVVGCSKCCTTTPTLHRKNSIIMIQQQQQQPGTAAAVLYQRGTKRIRTITSTSTTIDVHPRNDEKEVVCSIDSFIDSDFSLPSTTNPMIIMDDNNNQQQQPFEEGIGLGLSRPLRWLIVGDGDLSYGAQLASELYIRECQYYETRLRKKKKQQQQQKDFRTTTSCNNNNSTSTSHTTTTMEYYCEPTGIVPSFYQPIHLIVSVLEDECQHNKIYRRSIENITTIQHFNKLMSTFVLEQQQYHNNNKNDSTITTTAINSKTLPIVSPSTFTVMFNVDATKLETINFPLSTANTTTHSLSSNVTGTTTSNTTNTTTTTRTLFDRIIFNFPHWKGKSNIRYNRQLMDEFFQSATKVLYRRHRSTTNTNTLTTTTSCMIPPLHSNSSSSSSSEQIHNDDDDDSDHMNKGWNHTNNFDNHVEDMNGEIHVALVHWQGGMEVTNLLEWKTYTWMVPMYASEAGLLLYQIQNFYDSIGTDYHRTSFRGEDRPFFIGTQPVLYRFSFPSHFLYEPEINRHSTTSSLPFTNSTTTTTTTTTVTTPTTTNLPVSIDPKYQMTTRYELRLELDPFLFQKHNFDCFTTDGIECMGTNIIQYIQNRILPAGIHLYVPLREVLDVDTLNLFTNKRNHPPYQYPVYNLLFVFVGVGQALTRSYCNILRGQIEEIIENELIPGVKIHKKGHSVSKLLPLTVLNRIVTEQMEARSTPTKVGLLSKSQQ